MTTYQILKTIIKIVTIFPVITAGVKAIIRAYKDQNIEDDLSGLFK